MSDRSVLTIFAAGAIAILAWGAGSSSFAQMGPGYGPGMMQGRQGNGPGYGPGRRGFGYGPGMMMGGGAGMMMGSCGMFASGGESAAQTFADGRVAFLKAELRITDAQKTEWEAYAKAIKDNLQNMQGMWQIMQTMFEGKTPVERLEAQIAGMDSRVASLKEIKPALTALYTVLSDDQKKRADELLTGMGCMM